MTCRADIELSWYFGSGPSTAAGDSGLRSSLSGQIAALESSRTSDDRPGVLERYVVDSSRIEDEMIRRVGAGTTMREVRRRLAAIPDRSALVLQLHYGERPLAFGISGCAVLCRGAADLVAPVTREGLNEALRAASKAGRSCVWVELELEAQALLKVAQGEYEQVCGPETKMRRVWAE